MILPHEHALSLRVADAAATFQRRGLPAGVVSCVCVAPGLVDLALRCKGPGGYAGRAWTLRLGGKGESSCLKFMYVYAFPRTFPYLI